MNDPIRVTLGIADEIDHMPMDFWIYDDGVKFESSFTRTDLQIAYAVLMDVADVP